jgi:serine/threonine protein kinase
MDDRLPDFSNYGYRAIQILGRNRQGGRITYLAQALGDGHSVVIKQFEFAAEHTAWSSQEALEREGEILQQLTHPRIPCYLGSFSTAHSVCLVQAYINAPSLALVGSLNSQHIREIALSVLEILAYLQSQNPPILHRDIKPENILLDSQNNAYLIDLGFGRAGIEEISGSSTVKGTLGFIPPEQLWGQISKASDLYSLGMTLICLSRGLSSADLCRHLDLEGRPNLFALVTDASDDFLAWLDRLVQPNPENRFRDAATALSALQSLSVIPAKTKRRQWRDGNGRRQSSAWKWAGWFGLGAIALTTLNHRPLPTSLPTSRLSQDLGSDIWQPTHPLVHRGDGFALYSDRPRPQQDAEMLAFLNQFRREVATHLFFPGSPTCRVDVYLMREDKNYYAATNHYGLTTDYGFYVGSERPTPAIVVREASGLGTLTHQMMYHYLACSYPEGLPPWAAQGAATFVEKFLAIERDGELQFSWGYCSNWRDPELLKRIDRVDLASTLRNRRDQNVFRSLFLYLHHQRQLVPLLNRLHGARNDGIEQLERTLGVPITTVDQQWRQWFKDDALDLPMVEASFAVWGKDARQVKIALARLWRWDEQRQMWLPQSDRSPHLIPALDSLLQN